MRWLFLFVLLVNIVFVSWEISQSTDESTALEPSTDIPTIELLSETGQATKVPTQEAPEITKPVQASRSTTQQTKKSTASEKKQAKTTAPVVTIPDTNRCFTLGPFRELDNLREFTRAIKDYVIAASFRSREEQEQSMFWVYLEPVASMKEAKKLGKRLESKKIKDYYVISSGPKAKGISLGHFKEKGRAQAHTESIQKLGFKPLVEPVFKSYTIYWLDYKVPAGKVIPQKIFSKHLSKKINRLDRSCS
jgi:hypothetical protein